MAMDGQRAKDFNEMQDVAEREGFEPSVEFPLTLSKRFLQPLGHLSAQWNQQFS